MQSMQSVALAASQGGSRADLNFQRNCAPTRDQPSLKRCHISSGRKRLGAPGTGTVTFTAASAHHAGRQGRSPRAALPVAQQCDGGRCPEAVAATWLGLRRRQKRWGAAGIAAAADQPGIRRWGSRQQARRQPAALASLLRSSTQQLNPTTALINAGQLPASSQSPRQPAPAPAPAAMHSLQQGNLGTPA